MSDFCNYERDCGRDADFYKHGTRVYAEFDTGWTVRDGYFPQRDSKSVPCKRDESSIQMIRRK